MAITSAQSIPKGYNQTDIGLIPNDWKLISFDQAFSFLQTSSFSREQMKENGDVQCVHYGDIHVKLNHFVDFSKTSLSFITNYQAMNYSYLKDGDLIMADASEDYEGVGKSVEVKGLGDKKAISGLHTFLLRDKNDNFVNGYKGYICSNRLVKQSFDRYATGLKVYGISKNNLKLIQIPKPPKPEQAAIAAALSDTDALIKGLEILIAKKRAIKQGAMQKLLSGERRLPGFKGKWVKKALGELAVIKDGTHQTPKYVDDGIPFYSVENITQNDFINTKYISHQQHKDLTRKYCVEKMDILMTRIGSIGDCKIITWEVNASFYVSLALIKLKDKSTAPYIFHYMCTQTFKKELEDRSLQWAVPKKINLGEISKCEIRIPVNTKEQSAIAGILSDMNDEIESLEKRLSKFKKIKQGMMQVLLTGKVRLV
jgi:type I restriction enzyme S subunit